MQFTPAVVIRRLSPADWALFREIRLRALADSPAAFGSTLAEATRLDESAWRGRLAARAQFAAMRGSEAVGTAAGIAAETGAELISMWVDPRARGSGVADQLVSAVVDWANRLPYGAISLWVADGNRAAERLYRRHGFRRTGLRQALDPGRPGLEEFQMRRALDLGGPTRD